MPFLDWVNKNQAKDTSRDVPYHLLHQEQTYGDAADNLPALKALIPSYAGKVKCIFIALAYNTQNAFAQLADKLKG